MSERGRSSIEMAILFGALGAALDGGYLGILPDAPARRDQTIAEAEEQMALAEAKRRRKAAKMKERAP